MPSDAVIAQIGERLDALEAKPLSRRSESVLTPSKPSRFRPSPCANY
jgi:hypothetical protein